MTAETARYLADTSTMDRLFNRMVTGLNRVGISLLGSRELRVRGRKSGEWRSTPVNLLTVDGERYLVAPRGVTQWVRNLRAAGTGELRVGRRTTEFRGVELPDEQKTAILRPYLKRWKFEVDKFFDGVTADSPDDVFERIAPGYPIFRVVELPEVDR